ncbi:acylphosphatase [Escherichia coli]
MWVTQFMMAGIMHGKQQSRGVQLRIRGKVQGVGFRPFVWQLAQQLNLHGDVCNDGDGVELAAGRPGNVSCSIASALSATGAY